MGPLMLDEDGSTLGRLGPGPGPSLGRAGPTPLWGKPPVRLMQAEWRVPYMMGIVLTAMTAHGLGAKVIGG
jgi:hypothetical protein